MEVLGWIIRAALMGWAVYSFCRAVPQSIARRKAEEDAYWRSEGVQI